MFLVMLEVPNSAFRPRITSAGANASSVSEIGITFTFQPRRAPSARSALQRASDQIAARRPARGPS
jgi:hypothetical protein